MAETSASAIAWTRSAFGPSPHPPRDGDKKQARQRINVLVRTGKIPHPNTLPCVDCGHVWHSAGRHEYDHHMGYAAEHHYDVEPVCTRCHSRRSFDRGELTNEKLKAGGDARRLARKQICDKGHSMSYGKDGMWRCYECRRSWYREYRRQRRAEGHRNG